MRQAFSVICLTTLTLLTTALPLAAQPPQDMAAYEALIAAADKGDAEAAFQVAAALTDSSIVTYDPIKRNAYLDIAVAQNHGEALMMRAMDFEAGNAPIAQDNAQALNHYLRSAKAGFVGAQTVLSIYYETGDLVGAPDLVRACAWIMLAIRSAKAQPDFGAEPGSDQISDLEEARDTYLMELSAEDVKAAEALSYKLLDEIQL
ncbi:sel1 repeat-containing protein [Asticcacaulis biprosthecium C19]|uniref:Sel1 repeat-containing protein n=1 Tax=Asticcacaulis biprosthecium C19 TaxID=715226 RepID=F4QU73_9CAUL|nr:hypothetical protein [Asticcacaulis biprosthecium]EGF89373.1 sel1 repeat-containing protein [Asticcacaulis biprosthecium C19]